MYRNTIYVPASSRREDRLMWETLALLLSGIGLIVALTLVSVEVPAILDMAYRSHRNRLGR
jgi:hypothetical protein